MTRLKKIGILAVMMCMLIPYSAFAQDQVNPYGLSDESVTFLQSHGVSLSVFGSSNALSETEKVIPLDDSIISLERQAEAYGFTDDQIQKYVQGMVNTPTHIIKDSDFAGSNAIDRDPRDQGVGYEVQSNRGFYEATSVATLPSIDVADHTSGYMFFTSEGDGLPIDLGLWYGMGKGGLAWRGCCSHKDKSGSATVMEAVTKPLYDLHQHSKVYIHAMVTSNGYFRMIITDYYDSSKVYMDESYPNWGTKNGAVLNRQISLCNDYRDFTNGSSMENAQFDTSNIYSSTHYGPPDSSNTNSNRCGVFGVSGIRGSRDKVTVNNYEPWYFENVSINFR